jgi:hypothetical protein
VSALVRPQTFPERRARAPKRLSGGSRRVIAAVADLVAPARAPFAFDAGAHAVAFVESYLAYMPPLLARAFPLGLFALEWSALPLAGGRFSRLPLERRGRHVERLTASRLLAPLFDIWFAVRGLVACAIYSHPEAQARIGYAHQGWLDAKTKERKERFGAPEPW